MSDQCKFCNGVRVAGWSGSGPIPCPACCDGYDALTVITRAWKEQRMRVIELEREIAILRSALEDLAEGDCSYGDGCPRFAGSRHGQCVSCKAREALAEATAARLLSIGKHCAALSDWPAADAELYDEEGLP